MSPSVSQTTLSFFVTPSLPKAARRLSGVGRLALSKGRRRQGRRRRPSVRLSVRVARRPLALAGAGARLLLLLLSSLLSPCVSAPAPAAGGGGGSRVKADWILGGGRHGRGRAHLSVCQKVHWQNSRRARGAVQQYAGKTAPSTKHFQCSFPVGTFSLLCHSLPTSPRTSAMTKVFPGRV